MGPIHSSGEALPAAHRVADTTDPPFCAFGMLAMIWDGGAVRYAGGALVDDRTVLTCGQCLIDLSGEQPARPATAGYFYPRMNTRTPENPPGGGIEVAVGVLAARYYDGDDHWDLGVCRLRRPVLLPSGAVVSTPVVTGDAIAGTEIALSGYPLRFDGEMWSGTAQVYSADVLITTMQCAHSTFSGSAGSPMYVYDPNINVIAQHGVYITDEDHGLQRGVLLSPAAVDWVTRASTLRVPDKPYYQLFILGEDDMVPMWR